MYEIDTPTFELLEVCPTIVGEYVTRGSRKSAKRRALSEQSLTSAFPLALSRNSATNSRIDMPPQVQVGAHRLTQGGRGKIRGASM
jgi:hypothetical protein